MFDTTEFKRSMEERDAATLMGFYANDASLRIIDKARMPSSPLDITGKAAVDEYFADVCGRAMTHQVEYILVDGDRLAFNELCAYPDGVRVYCGAFADLRDGKIVRQTQVQAWDE